MAEYRTDTYINETETTEILEEETNGSWDTLKIELGPEVDEGNLSGGEIWPQKFSVILLQRGAGENAVGML